VDVKEKRDAARAAANVLPLRSKIFSFFSFEVCMFLAAAIIFSVHVYLKNADEKLLNEGVAVQGVITDKMIKKKTANKGKSYFYEHTVHYRFNYYFREYTGSNIVNQRLSDKVKKGDAILIAVDSDNPGRSRIKSPDVITGFIYTLKFVGFVPLVLGVISSITNLIQKLRKKILSTGPCE